MLNSRTPYRERGASLIEVVIGAAIVVVVLIGALSAFQVFLRSGLATTTKLQAAFLAEEGIEAARSIRDRSWSEFSGLSSGTYHLVLGSQWNTTTTPQLIDGVFTRTISVGDVYRRTSDSDIVPSTSPDSKAIDLNTKRVLLRVSWGETGGMLASYENGTTDGSLGSFPSNNAGDGDVVQSFTPIEDGTAASVEIYAKRAAGTSPSAVYVELRGGSAVGPVIASSATQDAASWSTTLSWIAFPLSSSVALSGGTEYFLRLRSVPDSTVVFSGSSGPVHWGYRQTASSPYSGGAARRYVGRQGNQNDQGQLLSQYDFSFRISAIESGGSVEHITYLTNLFE